jgi:hypothetical protein
MGFRERYLEEVAPPATSAGASPSTSTFTGSPIGNPAKKNDAAPEIASMESVNKKNALGTVENQLPEKADKDTSILDMSLSDKLGPKNFNGLVTTQNQINGFKERLDQ